MWTRRLENEEEKIEKGSDHWSFFLRDVFYEIAVRRTFRCNSKELIKVDFIHLFDSPTFNGRLKLMTEWEESVGRGHVMLHDELDSYWVLHPIKTWMGYHSHKRVIPDWFIVTRKDPKTDKFSHMGLERRHAAGVLIRLSMAQTLLTTVFDEWKQLLLEKEQHLEPVIEI